MSWMNLIQSGKVEFVSRWMTDVSRHYARTMGAKWEPACALAARDLGLTERRGRSFLRREPVRLSPEEFQEIARRYDEYLVRRAGELICEADRLIAESKRATREWKASGHGQENYGGCS